MRTLSRFLAWLAWGAVHLELLAQSSLRISVFVKSVWTYITQQREHHRSFFTSRRERFASARPALNRSNGLHLADTLLYRERQEETRLTFRIHRSATPDVIVFALSGDLDMEHLARLQELLTTEPAGRVTFDLKDVTLVDRAAVQFRASAGASRMRIVNRPEYVRSWIAAERNSQMRPTQDRDRQQER